jgi:hypothetical protein
MLVIDRIPKPSLSVDGMIARMLRMVLAGLLRPGMKESLATAVRSTPRAGRRKVGVVA